MRVSDFISWLKERDQDAEVYVVYHTSGSGYYDQGGNVELVVFDSTPGSSDNNWNQHYEEYQDSLGNKMITIGSTGN